MIKTTRPRDADGGAPDPALEVDVARTGGIAGMTRRWSAQPPAAEAPEWRSLIERCPWDDVPPPWAPEEGAHTAPTATTSGPEESPALSAQDRGRPPVPEGFVWLIRASWAGSDPREAELFDDQVVGAWRELIDAVREWNRQRPGPERPGR
jgi:hypothetical protein